MTKSPDAFRTISEVAEWLDRPAHVLRFWESKFTQIKPIKRAGGRRYYRPDDMLLLGGIKRLLHDEGMTIKGVQKLLREQGIKHVAGLSQPLDVMAEPGELVPSVEKVEALKEKVETPESATLLQFPGTANAAEDELAETSYEQAAGDLAPNPTAEAMPEDTTEAQPSGGADFEAPSFFSMFDTVDPDAVAQSDEAPVEPPESGSPQIHVADVAVDASSDVGPGVLTHLWQAGANAAVSDRAQLQSLQEKLREISKRMRAG